MKSGWGYLQRKLGWALLERTPMGTMVVVLRMKGLEQPVNADHSTLKDMRTVVGKEQMMMTWCM